MESPRYLRIVLPPFVLYGAVILAHAFNNTLVQTLTAWDKADVLTVMAGIVAASIVPVGFLMGGLTQLLLFGLGKLGCVGYGGRYDLPYPTADTQPLMDDLGLPNTESGGDHLNAARVFVYEARGKWLGEHIGRLWDASLAYSGSVLALFFAIVYAVCMRICEPVWWGLAVATAVLCWGMAFHTRKEIRYVVTLQIKHRNVLPRAVAGWTKPKTPRKWKRPVS